MACGFRAADCTRVSSHQTRRVFSSISIDSLGGISPSFDGKAVALDVQKPTASHETRRGVALRRRRHPQAPGYWCRGRTDRCAAAGNPAPVAFHGRFHGFSPCSNSAMIASVTAESAGAWAPKIPSTARWATLWTALRTTPPIPCRAGVRDGVHAPFPFGRKATARRRLTVAAAPRQGPSPVDTRPAPPGPKAPPRGASLDPRTTGRC